MNWKSPYTVGIDTYHHQFNYNNDSVSVFNDNRQKVLRFDSSCNAFAIEKDIPIQIGKFNTKDSKWVFVSETGEEIICVSSNLAEGLLMSEVLIAKWYLNKLLEKENV